jgi:caa(3)-type oxidase subunit IV
MSETTNTEAAAAAHHEDHEALYWKIGGMLFALTVATVLVSKIHIPNPWGILVGLAIATAKAFLVASVFMHLKWEKKTIHQILYLTGFFCIFLFLLPILDSAVITDRVFHDERPAILDTGKAAHGEEGSAH